MPAITVDNPLVLPRVPRPDPASSAQRPVVRVVPAHRAIEGAGFEVARPFPGLVTVAEADPFLMLDHIGPTLFGPGEAGGAPWHPHRGFETVTYIMDGEVSHHDTHGGGGIIGEGETQWMTAGSGLLHDELPTERVYRQGGWSHGVQLWVNLPSNLKMTTPRYQAIARDQVTLLTSDDGGALLRLIAGDLGGHSGPGATHTPITYVHATLAPGARLAVPWVPEFTTMAYVLTGQGAAGPQRRPIRDKELVLFGAGDSVVLEAADKISGGYLALDVLLIGGLPIREPIASYGPFVMNTHHELTQAVEDFRAGRLGIVPAEQRAPRNFS